ncbi:MAG: YfjI family protein [Phycisphaerae bacterium]|nr:YfjI family protein [Phycisphaerae bacterium]
MTARADAQMILRALSIVAEPGQVVEVRVPEARLAGSGRAAVISGFYNDMGRLATDAASLGGKGIFVTLNPVNAALLARCANRTQKAASGTTTSDTDIIKRRWVLVDIDPKRPAGISATDAEHDEALAKAQTIADELHAEGWPMPVEIDSGNGAHLWYRVDLPADDDGLVRRFLAGLAERYNDDVVEIDRAVFNPARITKLPGTTAAKGDNTPDRPHRMAKILRVPSTIEPVSRELLEQAAEPVEEHQGLAISRRPGAINQSPETLRDYLAAHGVTVKAIKSLPGGGAALILDGCPMNAEHGQGTDTAVILRRDGLIGFECKHNGCVGVGWRDLRNKIDPDHQQRTTPKAKPATPRRRAPRVEKHRAFPVRRLPGRLRGFVEAVSDATGTAPAYAALAALVVAAGCVGNRAAVLVKRGWVEPCVLWGALIGRSGTTKTPLLMLVIQALQEMYKADRAAFTEAMRDYAAALEHHNVALTSWKREQQKKPPTDPPIEPERPREKRLIVSDITMEKLGCLLEDNPLGLLLVRDELAAWVGAFDRYAPGGKGSDRPAWLSMHSAAPVTIDRKSGTGTLFVERAAVSVIGGMQPGTLARVFGMAEREAGLLARALLVYPPDRPALWSEAELSEDMTQSWYDLLRGLLELAPAEDEAGSLRPRLIPMSPDAKAMWVEWHDAHVRELADIENDDLAAHFAKLKGICARLALLFTCVEVASGGYRAENIGAVQMQQAIDTTEWFKAEARRVYAILGETPEDRARRRLVELVQRKGGKLTVRELQRSTTMYATSEDAETALDDLVSAGYGEWEEKGPTPRGGRPSRVFQLTGRADSTKPQNPEQSRGCVNVGAVSAATDEDPWGDAGPSSDGNPPTVNDDWGVL